MSDSDGDIEQSLHDKIHERLTVDAPEDAALVDAVGDAVEIVRGTWKLRVKESMKEREHDEQVFTYLLAAHAAHVVSEGERPMSVTREELIDVFGEEIVEDVIWHGWLRTFGGSYAQIRPECLAHAADELARRYGDSDGN